MLLNVKVVTDSQKNLQEKIDLWESNFPTLNFDSFGRTKIAKLPAIDNDIIDTYINRMSETFFIAFNSCLKQKNYAFRSRDDGFLKEITYLTEIEKDDFIGNEIHFVNLTNDKKIIMKMSKFLSFVQDIWNEQNNNQYVNILQDIKKLRQDGQNYETSTELQILTQKKKSFETGNLFITYQEMVSANSGENFLYLSVNPLDLLTSSGSCEGNPTNFSSCWSQKFIKSSIENIYNVEVKMHYREFDNLPESILALGKIVNRGILFIKNNNSIIIPTMELYGYKDRSHIWLDDQQVFVEKAYPNNRNRDHFIKLLKENKIEVIEDEEIDECQEFEIQDIKGIENYLRIADNTDGHLFLDREFFNDENKLCYLSQNRCDGYNYNNGDRYPEMEDDRIRCCTCGELIDEDDCYGDNGDAYCQSCYDDNFAMCDHCYEYHAKSDMTDIGGSSQYLYICNDCIDHYYQCQSCNEWLTEDSMYCNEDGETYCEACYNDIYTHCENCNEEVEIDNIQDGNLCQSCYEEEEEEEEEEEGVV